MVFSMLIQISENHLKKPTSNVFGFTPKHADLEPDQWWPPPKSNPSPLRDLKLQLIYLNGTSASLALNITWSINIDSSIHSINSTWIEVNTLGYRCMYQPPFTSKQIHTGDLQQIWFNFTATDVNIEPSSTYYVAVYNLPPAPPQERHKYTKQADVQVPGCDVEWMRDHSTCLQTPSTQNNEHWEITTTWMKDGIQVTFDSHLNSKKYEIRLRREWHILNFIEVNVRGDIETLTGHLTYSGPCENLEISITPFFEHCGITCRSTMRKVDCQAAATEEPKKNETPILLISIGCAVAITLLFICQLRRCKRSGYSRGLLNTEGSVGVLVVYPAVDSVFQNAVMAVADFLQSHRELNVIIDVWQRGSLAEQGPLRWLNSQVDCAEKVLIILPPQHTTDTAALKPNMGGIVTDYTVPASACELFSMALTLVASCAHDPQQHHKFLVVHLNHGGLRSTMPVELRGCKTLILPRDLEKLHQISSRKEVTSSSCRFESCGCKDRARKVRDTVQMLDESKLPSKDAESKSRS
ncbi:interleukin-17 receptor B isoform X2 [Tachysurus fulvidraco]|uniref:interleukin-17 receptor B isoform X2 n=1 Tax=Tachysurus fulvidraco TaxID=1234273 RepID=UPI001FEE278C|nr:interleukin-17 receptor B isoform X2 [Tachysurus fulvidraco]